MIEWLLPGILVLGAIMAKKNDEKHTDMIKNIINDAEEKTNRKDEHEKAIQYSKMLADELKKEKEEMAIREKMVKEKDEEIIRLKDEIGLLKSQNVFQLKDNFIHPYARRETFVKPSITNNEQKLSAYLRDVCYRKKRVTFHVNEDDFYVKTIENDAYIYLLLQQNDTLQAKGIVAKDVMRLIDIDFLQYGEKERYLVRNYFEKIVNEYLLHELEVKQKLDEEVQKEKGRREKEILEIKKQEHMLLDLVIQKYEEIQGMIRKIEENDADISVETKYNIEKHYTSYIEETILAFRDLSLEDKKREHKQFLSALEDVKSVLKREIESMEKEKVFAFKKQIRVLQERSRH